MARGMSSKQKKAFKRKQKEELVTEEANVKKSPSRTPDAKPTPTSMLIPINLSLRNEHEKDEQTEMSSLTDTQHYTESKTLVIVVGTMVANTLSYGDMEKHALVFQLSTLRIWDRKRGIT